MTDLSAIRHRPDFGLTAVSGTAGPPFLSVGTVLTVFNSYLRPCDPDDLPQGADISIDCPPWERRLPPRILSRFSPTPSGQEIVLMPTRAESRSRPCSGSCSATKSTVRFKDESQK